MKNVCIRSKCSVCPPLGLTHRRCIQAANLQRTLSQLSAVIGEFSNPSLQSFLLPFNHSLTTFLNINKYQIFVSSKVNTVEYHFA